MWIYAPITNSVFDVEESEQARCLTSRKKYFLVHGGKRQDEMVSFSKARRCPFDFCANPLRWEYVAVWNAKANHFTLKQQFSEWKGGYAKGR